MEAMEAVLAVAGVEHPATEGMVVLVVLVAVAVAVANTTLQQVSRGLEAEQDLLLFKLMGVLVQ
jgi:hypothetical protein